MLGERGLQLGDPLHDFSSHRFALSTEPQAQGTVIMDCALLGYPALADQVVDDHTQSRRLDTQCGRRVFQLGILMAMQIEDHPRLERRHPHRLQASSEVAVQPQHQFQQREACLLLAIVLGNGHGDVSISRVHFRWVAHEAQGPSGHMTVFQWLVCPTTIGSLILSKSAWVKICQS